MSTTTTTSPTKKNPTAQILADNVRIYLEIKSAFEQCDDEIKAAVNDMTLIVSDETATEDERKRALFTIVEAIFPSLAVDFMSFCDSIRKLPDSIARSQAMAAEEATFADRVQALMTKQRITQEELADKIGVGQSAISNMLNRQCRPQRRTVGRIAEALNVRPEELWPNAQDE